MIQINSDVKDGTIKATVIANGSSKDLLKELAKVTLQVLQTMSAQNGTRLMNTVTPFQGVFINEVSHALMVEAAELLGSEE